jgi:SAM-dependent methyltransferase
MTKIEPFEKHPREYDAWFSDNRFAYESEIQAVRAQLPDKGDGIEVGVGSARFAAALGIRLGVEPSGKMRELARARGVTVIGAVAEMLPFLDCQFNYVLMVTAICFFDAAEEALGEARRVLKSKGQLIIGFIDRESALGRLYEGRKAESIFYKTAKFYSSDEVKQHLMKAGFESLSFVQTLFRGLPEIKSIQPVKKGYGQGSFVVIKASKPKDYDKRNVVTRPKGAVGGQDLHPQGFLNREG